MAERPHIIVTGAGGLVGRALSRRLIELGYEVVPFRSRASGPCAMDADKGTIDRAALEGAHAVVHLAGESIAQRWTDSARDRILRSRRDNTRLLTTTLAGLSRPPRSFISMSGTSRYGLNTPDVVDEQSPVSDVGFLGEVAREWEEALRPASQAGIRTVALRSGMVLAASGGALAKMLPAFRLGLGGPIGSGQQRVSWIRLGDLVELIVWTLGQESVRGPVNAVSPETVTQSDFARTLGRTLGRPAFLPLPAWGVGLLFGQMGRETILSDLAVRPSVALDRGFRFGTPGLVDALKQALRE